MQFFNQLKKFDAYPKTQEDFRIRTASGATVSILTFFLIVFLSLGELSYFLTHQVSNELSVDNVKDEKLRINIDIVFPRMACAFMSIDAMDISGSSQYDVLHHLVKHRLDPMGVPVAEPVKTELASKDQQKNATQECGSCYGAETPNLSCCNTCEDVREAYRLKGWAFAMVDTMKQCVEEHYLENIQRQNGEGCAIEGFLEVSKVAGNFHFAPGRSFTQMGGHVHDMALFDPSAFNMSHYIRKLSFGSDYPGIINPLDGVSQSPPSSSKGAAMYQYFVKVVPTVYQYLNGTNIFTNQYAVTDHYREVAIDGSNGVPGVFFMYDLSPIMVNFVEKTRSLSHFLTGVCAIVGGVFTVAGLLDRLIFLIMQKFKNSIGKGT